MANAKYKLLKRFIFNGKDVEEGSPEETAPLTEEEIALMEEADRENAELEAELAAHMKALDQEEKDAKLTPEERKILKRSKSLIDPKEFDSNGR